jgi:hypothetical protein
MWVRNDWNAVVGYSHSPTKVVDGNWHHLMAIYDGQTLTTYIDGIKDDSVPYTEGMLPNDSPLYIGVDPDVWGSAYWGARNFRGDLDDVRIYNRALSETEVQQLAGLNVTSTDNSIIISNWEYKMVMTPNSDANAIEVPMQVTSKADGSYEGNNGKVTIAVSPQATVRKSSTLTESDLCIEVGAALTTDGQSSIICATGKTNGDVVLSDPQDDTVEPLTVNKDGELVLTDGSVQVTVNAEGGFVGTDADNPQHQVVVTPEGQVTVTDSSAPNIIVTMNADGSLTGKDTVSGTEVTISRQGEQVVTHPDFPGMQATVNEDGTLTVTDTLDPDAAGVAAIVDIQTNSYQVINLATGMCYYEDSNLRKKSIFKKIAGFISNAVGLVAKVATEIAPIAKVIGKVAGTISNIVGAIIGKAPQINDWAINGFIWAWKNNHPLILGIAGFVAIATTATTPASGFLGFLGTVQTVAKVVSAAANAVPKIASIAQKVSNWFGKWKTGRGLREGNRPLTSECDIISLATLNDFTAISAEQSVLLQWETAGELNSMGFEIYRAKPPADGQCQNKRVEDYQEITKLTERPIPATGSRSQGASYSFEDNQVVPKTTYCYGLEEINEDGTSFIHWDWIATAVAR